ncbi:MAG: cytochrome c [Archangium sp.]|nr:cytochrome c [Archangium sp.]
MNARLVGLAAAVLLSITANAEEPKTVKKGLSAPGYLNATARGLLKRRMERHGKDMLRLVNSVLMLERAEAKRIATEVAEEPRLTRPIAGGEDDLNTSLPERFFVLQDDLRVKAKAVAEVAGKGDDVSLAARTGEMMQVCVSCHSTYLEPAPQPK